MVPITFSQLIYFMKWTPTKLLHYKTLKGYSRKRLYHKFLTNQLLQYSSISTLFHVLTYSQNPTESLAHPHKVITTTAIENNIAGDNKDGTRGKVLVHVRDVISLQSCSVSSSMLHARNTSSSDVGGV